MVPFCFRGGGRVEGGTEGGKIDEK